MKRPLLVALVLSLLAACGGGSGEAQKKQEEPAEHEVVALSSGEKAAFHSSEKVAGKEEIELELDDNYFGPTVLEGAPGQTVALKMFNEGEAVHNFSLQAQGIDQDVKAGEKDVTVQVTFPESGAVTFLCKYHSAQDMRGELKVS